MRWLWLPELRSVGSREGLVDVAQTVVVDEVGGDGGVGGGHGEALVADGGVAAAAVHHDAAELLAAGGGGGEAHFAACRDLAAAGHWAAAYGGGEGTGVVGAGREGEGVAALGAGAGGAAAAVAAGAAALGAVASDGQEGADGGREVVVLAGDAFDADDVAYAVAVDFAEVGACELGLGLEDDAVGVDLDGVTCLVGVLADADGVEGVEGGSVAPDAGSLVVDEDGLSDDFTGGGAGEGGDVGVLGGADGHGDALAVGGVVDEAEVVVEFRLVLVDLDEAHDAFDEFAAFGLLVAVGLEGYAAHFAEHGGDDGGKLEACAVVHLLGGLGVTDGGCFLLEDDSALGALLAHGVAGFADVLDDGNNFCHFG